MEITRMRLVRCTNKSHGKAQYPFPWENSCRMLFYPLLLLSAPLVAFANTEENIIYRKVVDGPPCNPEPVSDLVPLCSNLGYNHTTFPNYRGLDAKETNEELSDLRTLIRTNCSNAILHLLCSIYAPPCMPAYPGWRYPPCKSLCEYVENGCGAVFKLISGYEWPPNQNLNCSRYTTYEQNHLSFCPPDPTVLQIPQSETEDTCKRRIGYTLYIFPNSKSNGASILFTFKCDRILT